MSTKAQQDWYQRNKKRLAKKAARYYQENKEHVLEKTRAYQREHKEHEQQRLRADYLENREEKLKKSKLRRDSHRDLINTIAVHYGCQNPDCCWEGGYEACHLDFHHLDPNSKEGNISRMLSFHKKRIATEINKCTVLCRNCHFELHEGNGIKTEVLKTCQVDEDLHVIS